MKMRFKEVLIWLFLFVVGSLILNFIISPSSIDIAKNTYSSIKDHIQPQKEIINYIEILPSKSLLSCSMIEMVGEANGMSIRSYKEKICKKYCGQENLNYGKFNCDRDQLTCYCVN